MMCLCVWVCINTVVCSMLPACFFVCGMVPFAWKMVRVALVYFVSKGLLNITLQNFTQYSVSVLCVCIWVRLRVSSMIVLSLCIK